MPRPPSCAFVDKPLEHNSLKLNIATVSKSKQPPNQTTTLHDQDNPLRKNSATPYAQVVRFLGKGSYGSVFEVQRLNDGQTYALKVSDVVARDELDNRFATHHDSQVHT
jgi:hypothetical protein